MRLLLLTLALATLAACSRPPRPEHAPPARLALDGLVIESSTKLDVSDPNARITAAAAAGAAWPGSPLEIAVKVLHGDLDTRELMIHEVKNRTEGADETVIEAAADGYLDDSGRGAWHRMVLRRQADRTWRLASHEIAYRCWRGHHLDAYSAELCP
ncbi:MAG TPA: hypothetical protein P5571_06355 [Candidatus Krumholzibacteria bacterium]|nr:hypothetical protein [Candidatus Krumholzibacteria bacterium]HRX50964.1 hypothetical protein [Candidatus Krumholzibacteria bacterium]